MTGPQAIERDLTVVNQWGLHGRTSAKLVQTARKFSADIWLVRDGVEVDCKSILDVMTMACTQGTPVKIKARGNDAEAALDTLAALINSKFGED